VIGVQVFVRAFQGGEIWAVKRAKRGQRAKMGQDLNYQFFKGIFGALARALRIEITGHNL